MILMDKTMKSCWNGMPNKRTSVSNLCGCAHVHVLAYIQTFFVWIFILLISICIVCYCIFSSICLYMYEYYSHTYMYYIYMYIHIHRERENYAEPIKPLKLVIMSATMRVGDFRNPRLFPSPPPIIKVFMWIYTYLFIFFRKFE
jgi:hypothetical protein